jgi:hypothetical protein
VRFGTAESGKTPIAATLSAFTPSAGSHDFFTQNELAANSAALVAWNRDSELPFPLILVEYQARAPEVAADLLLLGPDPVGRPEIYPYPKGGRKLRNLSVLEPRDLIRLRAAAGRIGARTTPVLGEPVYSHRVVARGAGWNFEEHGYQSWRRDILRRIDAWDCAAMVRTDISSFYESISLERLFRHLMTLGCDHRSVQFVAGVLFWWRDTARLRGLPLGNPASSVLGTAYLGPLDAAMRTHFPDYFRFSDDIAYFVERANEMDLAREAIAETASELEVRVATDKTLVYETQVAARNAVRRGYLSSLEDLLDLYGADGLPAVQSAFRERVLEIEDPDVTDYRWLTTTLGNKGDRSFELSIAGDFDRFSLDPSASARYLMCSGKLSLGAADKLMTFISEVAPSDPADASILHMTRVMATRPGGRDERDLFWQMGADTSRRPLQRAWAIEAASSCAGFRPGQAIEAAEVETEFAVKRSLILALRKHDRTANGAFLKEMRRYPAVRPAAEYLAA